MKIKTLHLVEGARKARGLTVIIDVFRAFSLACYMIDQGAERIIPVDDIQTAYRLKSENPDYMLVGEQNNMKPPGFDFGNSPFQVRNFDFSGKTVVHATSAGTKGIVNAVFSDEILTGSFVNAGAVIRYIKKNNPPEVSLVCMGYSASHPIEEDNYCAQYIQNSLENISSDFEQMVETIKSTSGRRFFMDDMQEHCPSEDFFLCLDLNRFDFILKAEKRSDGLINLLCHDVE
ncbi:MAG TPA: 2-phosphosulfolactate phosphatase [Bacteroidales bacterium]|nr:2-phosphosulfolactate phosphatase [Bacteroidales bacterium]